MSKIVAQIKQVESPNNECVGCSFDNGEVVNFASGCGIPEELDCGNNSIFKLEIV